MARRDIHDENHRGVRAEGEALASVIPLRMIFRGTDPSDAIERHVRLELDKLVRFQPRITDCAFTLEARPAHGYHGGAWDVRIALRVPGAEVAIAHDAGVDDGREDPSVTIHDAFAGARRALLHHAQRTRVETKAAAPIPEVDPVVPVGTP